jgi:hypothetical protein
MRNSRIQFVRSLGYLAPDPDGGLYSALMFQPRVVGAVTVTGVLLQAPWAFFTLSAALAWSALVPTRSLFDAIYNFMARRRGLQHLTAAPAPRRTAGVLAAMVTLLIGVALQTGATTTAWALEVLMVVASAAVVFGRSCAGAEIYRAVCRRRSSGACVDAMQPR